MKSRLILILIFLIFLLGCSTQKEKDQIVNQNMSKKVIKTKNKVNYKFDEYPISISDLHIRVKAKRIVQDGIIVEMPKDYIDYFEIENEWEIKTLNRDVKENEELILELKDITITKNIGYEEWTYGISSLCKEYKVQNAKILAKKESEPIEHGWSSFKIYYCKVGLEGKKYYISTTQKEKEKDGKISFVYFRNLINDSIVANKKANKNDNDGYLANYTGLDTSHSWTNELHHTPAGEQWKLQPQY